VGAGDGAPGAQANAASSEAERYARRERAQTWTITASRSPGRIPPLAGAFAAEHSHSRATVKIRAVAEAADGDGAGGRSGRARGVRVAAALLVFVAALATLYRGFWGADPTRSVPHAVGAGEGAVPKPVVRADYRLAVWAVGRNARTLLTRPLQLFDAEPCHPAERTLVLHHPVVAPAIVALPGQLATGDPVFTFNQALFLGALIAAFAMYLLVADWTGVPVAGIVAGLLYAFHASRVGAPHHFFTVDNAWVLLVLFFARRVLAGGGIRDGVGLGVAFGLQTSSSAYPLLAALALVLPAGVWLLWHYGLRRAAWAPALVAAAVGLAISLLVLVPYLSHDDTLARRSLTLYAPWYRFLPGGSLFPGWVCLLLVVLSLALPRERALARDLGDPRAALLVGALLVAWLATGGNAAARMAVLYGAEPPAVDLPNAFAGLRAVLPGLEGVRLPSALGPGVVQVACILAGLGAAALLRSLPPRALPCAAALLVAAAFVDTLRPAYLGLSPPVSYRPLPMRPPEATLALFDRLEQLGNAGPLLELPVDRRDKDYSFNRATSQHLLTAYHRRRTSGCYSSFVPPAVHALARLGPLSEKETLDRIRALGFTTVVVDRRVAEGAAAEEVERAALASGGRLEHLAETDRLVVWRLRDAEGASP
jgi:hypothetical protein